jgi:hypothetical protein
MTTATRSRRRPVRAVERVHQPGRTSLAGSVVRAATSREAKIAYAVIGTIGLAALAVAIIGPKRLEQQVIRPLRGRMEEHTARLWDESGPLREQIAGLFDAAGAGRERLVRSFQSWIGHFHAS